ANEAETAVNCGVIQRTSLDPQFDCSQKFWRKDCCMCGYVVQVKTVKFMSMTSSLQNKMIFIYDGDGIQTDHCLSAVVSSEGHPSRISVA
ncbi:hypothetical protein NPIL_269981, partial [Nephila pilipes]